MSSGAERTAESVESVSTAGIVFDVQRFSLHNGPGIRTTVFLKGCPLRCRWCHNPESQRSPPEIIFNPQACLGCGRCASACPTGTRRMVDGAPAFESSGCSGCTRCVRACPATALELVGRAVSAKEILDVVKRDRCFYQESGGGLTVSGGEPTAQPEFCLALLSAARAENIHTALDTSGFCDFRILESLLPVTDLFLYDVKADSERHQSLVGAPLAPIVDNLRHLAALGARIRLRLPLVPGVNDTRDHFLNVAALAGELPTVEAVDILPYHRLGVHKQSALFSATSLQSVDFGAPFPRPATGSS